jgi:hypothetical protein
LQRDARPGRAFWITRPFTVVLPPVITSDDWAFASSTTVNVVFSGAGPDALFGAEMPCEYPLIVTGSSIDGSTIVWTPAPGMLKSIRSGMPVLKFDSSIAARRVH